MHRLGLCGAERNQRPRVGMRCHESRAQQSLETRNGAAEYRHHVLVGGRRKLNKAHAAALLHEHAVGDLSEVLPVGFAPEYKPREHFLSAAQLEALLPELLPDGAARVAFTVATSAEDSVCDRAERADISGDLA